MGDLKEYLVTFDEDEDVLSTKLVSVAEVRQRTVRVFATSSADARKKASVLIGQRGDG